MRLKKFCITSSLLLSGGDLVSHVAPGCPLLDEDRRKELGVDKPPYRCRYCELRYTREKECPWYKGFKDAYGLNSTSLE